MKIELALLALLTLAGTALFFQKSTPEQNTLQESLYSQYSMWSAKFNKEAINGREDEYRFAVYQENHRLVELFNAKNNFKLGLDNQFAAMTNEEFRQYATNEVLRQNPPKVAKSNTRSIVAAPSTNIDWVAKGVVQSIQNQGQCGSCWAFSAVSQLESFYAINGGTLQDWSEQQVTSCTPSPSEGCNGGYPEGAMQYVAQNGMMQESAYPYKSGNTGITGQCSYDASTPGFIEGSQINIGYGNVPSNNPEALYNQLEQQTVSILVDGGSFVFQLYTSGIIDTDACGTSLDHAISLTGYTSGSTPYWTVRNSWGATWGNQGYAQIAYSSGNGYCGINMSPSYPTK